MKIAVIEDFTDMTAIQDRWSYRTPWGAGKNKQGVYSRYSNMNVTPNGLRMHATYDPIKERWDMPRLFWTGAPMGYGRYSLDMHVPKQVSVNTFVLYTRAYYKGLVRTILPEIDIAEYYLKEHPEALNVGIHRRYRRPKFTYEEKYAVRYADIKLRHKLDYKDHQQRTKQMWWDGKPHNHVAEITPHRVQIFLDGVSVFDFRSWREIPAFFTPNIGQSIPTHIIRPNPRPIIINQFTFEQ